MSSPVSCNAFWQSRMPAPVFSLSSLTNELAPAMRHQSFFSHMMNVAQSLDRGYDAGAAASDAVAALSSPAGLDWNSASSRCVRKWAPSMQASAMRDVMSLIERMASSFPGIGYVMLSGSQLLSMMAMTGISSLVASWTAI